MKRSGRSITVILSAALVTSGCTSLRGYPVPVITTAQTIKVLNDAYSPEMIKGAIQNPTQPFRDGMIIAHLSAIDARYFDFRAELSSEGREGAIGFDTALLGLSAAGALIKRSAPELAVVSGVFAGTRGSINKNLYFEKALPAIFAAMEAARFRVRTRVENGMKRNMFEYSIVSALSDLQQYQMAGTLDEAFAAITAETTAERSEARAEFNRAQGFACDVKDEIIPLRTRFSHYMRTQYILTKTSQNEAAISKAIDKIDIVAIVFGVAKEADPMNTINNINGRIELGYCDSDAFSKKLEEIQRLTGDNL